MDWFVPKKLEGWISHFWDENTFSPERKTFFWKNTERKTKTTCNLKERKILSCELTWYIYKMQTIQAGRAASVWFRHLYMLPLVSWCRRRTDSWFASASVCLCLPFFQKVCSSHMFSVFPNTSVDASCPFHPADSWLISSWSTLICSFFLSEHLFVSTND